MYFKSYNSLSTVLPKIQVDLNLSFLRKRMAKTNLKTCRFIFSLSVGRCVLHLLYLSLKFVQFCRKSSFITIARLPIANIKRNGFQVVVSILQFPRNNWRCSYRTRLVMRGFPRVQTEDFYTHLKLNLCFTGYNSIPNISISNIIIALSCVNFFWRSDAMIGKNVLTIPLL